MLKFLRRPLPLRVLNEKSATVAQTVKLSVKQSNTPRPPKDPPDEGYAPECVCHEGFEVAEYVRPEAYRQFSGSDEQLGPGAGKNKEYKNASYFGYHRFSFVELQNQSLELRDERRVSGGVQVLMEVNEEDECSDTSMEAMKKQEMECDEQLAAQAKDIENEKLKALCDAAEKKQKDLAKLLSNQSSEDPVKEVLSTIDKKVAEILTDCQVELKKVSNKEEPSKDDAKVLADCKEKIKEATDKAVLPADKKAESNPEEAQKESNKAEDAMLAEECKKLNINIDKFIERKEKENSKQTANEKIEGKQEVPCEEKKKTAEKDDKVQGKPTDNKK